MIKLSTTSTVKRFASRMAAIEKRLPKALKRGLGKWVLAAHKEAHRLLSGSNSDAAGAYPVPVRTGNLRRLENYVLPGRSKAGITARDGEAFLINAAIYATTIHKDRPFASDAIEATRNEGMKGITAELRQALMGVS